MDVIFCRNVLMYFTSPQAKKVIQHFHRSQLERGWLIVSSSELIHVSGTPYVTMSFPGTTLYQKNSRKAGAPPATREAPVSQFALPEPVLAIAPIAAPVVQPGPSAADSHARAAAFYEQGNYEQAVHELEESLSEHPGESAALGLMTRCLANQGRLVEANACCGRWIEADKLNPAVHYLRAVILQEQSAIEPAVESLRKALYLDPNFALAHFAMGNIARHRGNAPEGDKHLNTALRLLRGYSPDFVVPESDGITAGRFAEIVGTLVNVETAA
jgi:chemotaxis protein methyltransferase CheR